MPNLQKTFCTTREAANFLGVSVTTTQNWAESGLLDSWKTEGGHRRISRSSVERLISEPRTHRAIYGGGLTHSHAERRLHILIVEDNNSLQRLYQMRMNAWPFTPLVETAADGFEALVKIGIRCPDLLITDLNMPHIDGFKMLNALSSMPSCQEMRMLVISGMTPEEISAAGKLPTGTYTLPKPAPFIELEQIASALAEAKKLHVEEMRQARKERLIGS